jgi:hypothetical protein
MWCPSPLERLEDVVRNLRRWFEDAHLLEESARDIEAALISEWLLAIRSNRTQSKSNEDRIGH